MARAARSRSARPGTATGTNFSLFSEHAERVELCLFDADDRETRVDLPERTAFNWHGYLPGVGPGPALRLPRARALGRPSEGHRFNPHKLLIDPYAKAIEGPVLWDAANVLPYEPDGDRTPTWCSTTTDDADAIPKGVVVDPGFDWEGDRPPRDARGTRPSSTRSHVKGFTKRTRACARTCAAPTPAWPPTRPSPTCARSA